MTNTFSSNFLRHTQKKAPAKERKEEKKKDLHPNQTPYYILTITHSQIWDTPKTPNLSGVQLD